MPWSGIAVYYFLCDTCGFCFAPAFRDWSQEDFRRKIYNDDYIRVDPDYAQRRPDSLAAMLLGLLPDLPAAARHLDFGSGNGGLTRRLRDAGWHSVAHDPFDPRSPTLLEGSPFQLVTAFEVLEHAQDVRQLGRRLSSLLADSGLLVLSTLLSDGFLKRGRRMDWWYAAPRNGHISLFSTDSLRRILANSGLQCAIYPSLGVHFAWRSLPGWAAHVTRLASKTG